MLHEIGSFYFSNLAGSGIGAVLAAILAWYFFPASLPLVMALMAMFAGLFLLKERSLADHPSFIASGRFYFLQDGKTDCYQVIRV